MTTDIICLASSKGGSGKTTLTATIGTFLSKVGKRVLLIDCDEGTHGLTLMYLKEVNEFRKHSNENVAGLFEIIEGKAPEDIIQQSIVRISDNLEILPAKHTFTNAPDGEKGSYFDNLELVILYAKANYDFVFLDAQAGISETSQLAMNPVVSDMVILVSEYDPMSNAGVERMKAQLPKELDVSRTWVLLNKLLPEFVSKFSDFLTVARFLPPIPWTADVVRAYSRRKLALDIEGGNQFTLAVLAVLREILSDENAEDLESWVDKQTERLREPISDQINDAALQLKLLENEYRPSKSMVRVYARMIKSIFRLGIPTLAALGAIVGYISLEGGNSSLLDNIRQIFPSVHSVEEFSLFLYLGIFSIFVFGTILNSSLSIQQDTIQERDHLRVRKAEIEKRIRELKELESSNYEDLVENKI